LSKRSSFELFVVPVGDADLGVDLFERSNGNEEPHRVIRAQGTKLQACGDHVLEALKAAGYRPSDLRRNRVKPFELPEQAGVRLGLVLMATKPLSKMRRIEEISGAVRTMSDDEAYYWYSKSRDADHGHRAQRAFRDLWSDR
jgi:hypothetical protein